MNEPVSTSPTSPTSMVIRRRAGLMAVVAIGALGLSVAYLWWFAHAGGGVALSLGVVLGLVAVLHGLAWGDARTPLLVADETGLRVRLGGDWTGVPWSHVDRVEIDERGRLTDGHVAVLVTDDAAELDNAHWRSRLGATLNRWFYDAPLVVPYGLTTTVTVVDVPDTLVRLSDHRAPVVVLDGSVEEPEPTVSLTTDLPSSDPQQDLEADVRPDAPKADAGELPEPAGEAPEASPQPEPTRKPRRSFIAAREAVPTLPLAKVVAALRSPPARREDVTIPVRGEPATMGTLALSEPYPDVVTEPLPEIEHLRRREHSEDAPEDHSRQDDAKPVSNVGLIIDATTDLSARAMSKVRRSAPLAASTEVTRDPEAATPGEDDSTDDLVIGGRVQEARGHLEMSVDELADRTRIRPYVIESIEVDDFGPCGGDFYARGHLRMLARVLGIDPEPLLTSYEEQFATSSVDPRTVFGAELSAGATGMVRGGASGANWGGLVAAVLVLVLIWGVANYFADGTKAASTDVTPPQNSSGLGSPGPGNKPLPPPPPAEARVRLAAVGGDSRVVVKNRKLEVVFAGILSDGQVRMVNAVAPLHVMAVDGGVIRIGTQGKTLGYIGDPGVRSRQMISAP